MLRGGDSIKKLCRHTVRSARLDYSLHRMSRTRTRRPQLSTKMATLAANLANFNDWLKSHPVGSSARYTRSGGATMFVIDFEGAARGEEDEEDWEGFSDDLVHCSAAGIADADDGDLGSWCHSSTRYSFNALERMCGENKKLRKQYAAAFKKARHGDFLCAFSSVFPIIKKT